MRYHDHREADDINIVRPQHRTASGEFMSRTSPGRGRGDRQPNPERETSIKDRIPGGFSPREKLKSNPPLPRGMTLGPIAMPSEIEFVDSFQRPLSSKIMRRV
jgi:hypothetical protein